MIWAKWALGALLVMMGGIYLAEVFIEKEKDAKERSMKNLLWIAVWALLMVCAGTFR